MVCGVRGTSKLRNLESRERVQGHFKENVQREIKGAVGEVPDESAAGKAERMGWMMAVVGGVVMMVL
jgi:hypothetical protein